MDELCGGVGCGYDIVAGKQFRFLAWPLQSVFPQGLVDAVWGVATSDSWTPIRSRREWI